MPSAKPRPSKKADAGEGLVSKKPVITFGGQASSLPLTFASGLQDQIERNPELIERSTDLARDVRITVVLKTRSGVRLQDLRGMLPGTPLDEVRPSASVADKAAARLEKLGFKILRVGRFGITVGGPAATVQEALKVSLCIFSKPRRELTRSVEAFASSMLPPKASELYVAPMNSIAIRAQGMDAIDDFVFIPPAIFFEPAAQPPNLSFHHLQADQIRSLLNVSVGQGDGIKIALVDTGFFRHPFYSAHNLRYNPVSTKASPDPENDQHGHGTAIAYNVFATAPNCELLGFKTTGSDSAAIEDAADSGADIISCSWGWDHEQSFPVLEATIRDIVQEGKIVLFASGNGHFAWPGSMPEVLSIGGVYADGESQLEASDYASGFQSSLYPGRRVPDVCGLCGQRPKGIYIGMPCPPGSELDRTQSGPSFPDGDTTTDNDGWLAASGTSSATPQIAGIVALRVERARSKSKTLDTAGVRDILQRSATAVQRGRNAFGFPATGNPNGAVGYGLVNANAALALV